MPDTAELIASGSMTVEVIGTGAKVVEVLVPGPQGIQGPAGADGLGVTPYYFATGVVFGGGSGAANTTAINDLITMINAAGGGVLWIGPGLVRLDRRPGHARSPAPGRRRPDRRVGGRRLRRGGRRGCGLGCPA